MSLVFEAGDYWNTGRTQEKGSSFSSTDALQNSNFGKNLSSHYLNMQIFNLRFLACIDTLFIMNVFLRTLKSLPLQFLCPAQCFQSVLLLHGQLDHPEIADLRRNIVVNYVHAYLLSGG